MEINQANIQLHITDAITEVQNAVKDLRVQTDTLRDLQQRRDSAAKNGLSNVAENYNRSIDTVMANGFAVLDIAEKAGEILRALVLIQETFFNEE